MQKKKHFHALNEIFYGNSLKHLERYLIDNTQFFLLFFKINSIEKLIRRDLRLYNGVQSGDYFLIPLYWNEVISGPYHQKITFSGFKMSTFKLYNNLLE